MKEQSNKNAVVCGASQGIGLSIVSELLEDNLYQHVVATYRILTSGHELLNLKDKHGDRLILLEMDFNNKVHFELAFTKLHSKIESVDLLINCVGFLYDEHFHPEKSINDLDPELFIHSMRVNALPTLLLAQNLKKLLLKSKNSIFVSISAKVGSVEDNKTGGWYSYRASKAALNMCVKNLSIELNRLGSVCTVFAVHPGTTETRLSAPFMKSARKKYQIHTSAQTAKNILDIVRRSKNETHNGKFLSWNGEEIPW